MSRRISGDGWTGWRFMVHEQRKKGTTREGEIERGGKGGMEGENKFN